MNAERGRIYTNKKAQPVSRCTFRLKMIFCGWLIAAGF
jgi:hypothetical protein